MPYGILPMEAASPRRNRPLLRRSGEAPTAKRSSVGALLKTVTAAAQHVPETHGILSVSRLKKSGPPEHIMSAQDKMRQAIARYHGMLPLSPRKEEAAKTISSSLGVQATIDAKVPLPPTAYLDDLGALTMGMGHGQGICDERACVLFPCLRRLSWLPPPPFPCSLPPSPLPLPPPSQQASATQLTSPRVDAPLTSLLATACGSC